MKLKSSLPCLAALLFSSTAMFAATLADWTFETSAPAAAGPFTPEIGSGSALGHHAGAAVYSSPAGNGSSHSFSSTLWAVGDYCQFSTSTVGATHIIVSYDQTSSGTGPGQFNFQYSLDGTTFTTVGGLNTVLVNGAPQTAWSSGGTRQTNFTFTFDLSAITALNNLSVVYFRVTDASTTSAAGGTTAVGGTDRIDNFLITGATGTPPLISSTTPAANSVNAGTTASFTNILSAGDTPLAYFWYKGGAGYASPVLITNFTSTSFTNFLDLTNVTAANDGSYWVVVTNDSGMNATSAIVTLNVVDPAIDLEPVSQTALVGGRAQFSVLAGGTGLTYQWYFSDVNGVAIAPVGSSLPSGATISGGNTSTLTISGLTTSPSDLTNFVVVVSGSAGSPVTSTVASILSVGNSGGILAYWNFNSPFLDPSNAAPYQGIGTESALNVTAFVQPNPDADDPLSPNTGLGGENYPAATTLNKQAGFQFNTSTAGAKNVHVSFDSRGTTTPSKYQRLQFTTNGTDFIDYPASFEITAPQVSIYESFAFDLSGFPGVANNPNFGIRIVTEFESTASYGNTNDATYVGISNAYAPAGTLSYDVVDITADAITNNNQPPVVGAIADQLMEDGFPISVVFPVSDDTTPTASLMVTAVSLNPNISPAFSPVISGGSVHLGINSSLGNTVTNFVPVLVTVTDTNGDVSRRWFTLTITPANLPPAFTGLVNTNMLPNGSLVLAFTLTDDHTPSTSLTPTAVSGNSTVVPSDGTHLVLGGSGSARTLTITPAAKQVGAVPITVSATDGSGLVGSMTFVVEVRPNTNVVLIDYFNYDGSGPIDTLSGGLWANYSGHTNEMIVGAGVVTVDGVNHTEDVAAPLIGAPYPTNSGASLYSSYVMNYSQLPGTNGSYISFFKDSSTSNFVCRVWAFTNGVTSGFYRVGITTLTNDVADVVVFPKDLSLGTNYAIVTRLVLSNFVSTLWLNPITVASASVTDSSSVSSAATEMDDYALRESTADEGILTIAKLKAGLSFDAVFPSLTINQAGANVILNWSDPTIGLQSSTNVAGPYVDIVGATPPYTNSSTSPTVTFYKLGQ